MSRIFKLLFLFVVLVTLDQVTKSLVSETVLNPGFFLGSFSDSTPFFRIFCNSAVLAILLLGSVLIQFLTWARLPGLTLSLTVLQAALVGNGIDKIRFGAVRDFIGIPLAGASFIINVADIELWVGLAWTLVLIWKTPKLLWPEEDLRNKWFPYPKSQSKVVGVLLLVALLVALGNELLFWGYLQAQGAIFPAQEALVCFVLFTLLMLAVVFAFGVIWSNRVYGPLRAIGRYLKHQSTERVAIKLRLSDEEEAVREILSLLDAKGERKRD